MLTAIRTRQLLGFLLTAVLAVWVGGTILVDLMVLPASFAELPRAKAVGLGQAIFHRFNFLECLLGIAAFVLSFALGHRGWRTVRAHRVGTGVVLAMTIVSLSFLLVLTPAIGAKVGALDERGLDWDDADAMPPERAQLHTVHTVYAGLDLLKVLAGLYVFWLLAKRVAR